jgi:hypothetical protein
MLSPADYLEGQTHNPFVHMHNVVDMQVQVTLGIARSVDPLYLHRSIIRQILLHASTSREVNLYMYGLAVYLEYVWCFYHRI